MEILNVADYTICTTHVASFLIILAFCLINCCASQRSFLSLGTKIENKKPTSGAANGGKQRKSFFGAAAADINVNDSEIEPLEVVLEEDEQSDFLDTCEVGFDGIKLALKSRGNKPERLILDGSLRGKAKAGRMLAVMGPSGSGESSY